MQGGGTEDAVHFKLYMVCQDTLTAPATAITDFPLSNKVIQHVLSSTECLITGYKNELDGEERRDSPLTGRRILAGWRDAMQAETEPAGYNNPKLGSQTVVVCMYLFHSSQKYFLIFIEQICSQHTRLEYLPPFHFFRCYTHFSAKVREHIPLYPHYLIGLVYDCLLYDQVFRNLTQSYIEVRLYSTKLL